MVNINNGFVNEENFITRMIVEGFGKKDIITCPTVMANFIHGECRNTEAILAPFVAWFGSKMDVILQQDREGYMASAISAVALGVSQYYRFVLMVSDLEFPKSLNSSNMLLTVPAAVYKEKSLGQNPDPRSIEDLALGKGEFRFAIEKLDPPKLKVLSFRAIS